MVHITTMSGALSSAITKLVSVSDRLLIGNSSMVEMQMRHILLSLSSSEVPLRSASSSSSSVAAADAAAASTGGRAVIRHVGEPQPLSMDGKTVALNWPVASGASTSCQMIQLRALVAVEGAPAGWSEWSAPLDATTVATGELKLRGAGLQRETSERYKLEVARHGALRRTLRVYSMTAAAPRPFRVANQSSLLLAYRQVGTAAWDLLGAHEARGYDWDDPAGSKRLEVRVHDPTDMWRGEGSSAIDKLTRPSTGLIPADNGAAAPKVMLTPRPANTPPLPGALLPPPVPPEDKVAPASYNSAACTIRYGSSAECERVGWLCWTDSHLTFATWHLSAISPVPAASDRASGAGASGVGGSDAGGSGSAGGGGPWLSIEQLPLQFSSVHTVTVVTMTHSSSESSSTADARSAADGHMLVITTAGPLSGGHELAASAAARQLHVYDLFDAAATAKRIDIVRRTARLKQQRNLSFDRGAPRALGRPELGGDDRSRGGQRLWLVTSSQGPLRVLTLSETEPAVQTRSGGGRAGLRFTQRDVARQQAEGTPSAVDLQPKMPPVDLGEPRPSVQCVIKVHHIGFSLIDSDPAEVLYLSLNQLTFRSHHALPESIDGEAEHSLSLELSRLQMDSGLPQTAFPVLLAPAHVEHRVRSALANSDVAPEEADSVACLKLSVERLRQWTHMYCCSKAAVQLQPFVLMLEQNTVARLVRFFMHLVPQLEDLAEAQEAAAKLNAVSSHPSNAAGSAEGPSGRTPHTGGGGGVGAGTGVGTGSGTGATEQAATEVVSGVRELFLQEVDLGAISLTVTVQMDRWCSPSTLQPYHPSDLFFAKQLQQLGATLMSVSDWQIELRPLRLSDAFETAGSLQERVTWHYAAPLLRVVYGLLAKIHLLEPLVALYSDLRTALKVLVDEPARGLQQGSPGAFANGLARGAKLVAGGVSMSAGAMILEYISWAATKLERGATQLSFNQDFVAGHGLAAQEHVMSTKRGYKVWRTQTPDLTNEEAGRFSDPTPTYQQVGKTLMTNGFVDGMHGLYLQPMEGYSGGGAQVNFARMPFVTSTLPAPTISAPQSPLLPTSSIPQPGSPQRPRPRRGGRGCAPACGRCWLCSQSHTGPGK